MIEISHYYDEGCQEWGTITIRSSLGARINRFYINYCHIKQSKDGYVLVDICDRVMGVDDI